ncbi:MAG TPA: hypothetical protein VN442_22895 [Bryobacteraceae bacterium]|nr:hypothetical protein [Bryobacteraceae bacterium]
MKSKLILPGLLIFASLGTAQEGTAVSGPVSGFVFDQNTGALRPMLGMPGAAYLGEPLLAGVEAAGIAPDGTAALAVMEGRLYLASGLKTAEPVTAAVESAIEGADRFAWAPDGSSAAVYSSKSGRAQILRGLEKAPSAGEPFELSALPGAVSALAIAGDLVIAGVADAEAGGLYAARAGETPRLLAKASQPAAITVAGRDLYFADRERGQVWQIGEFAGDATPLLFAEGLEAPVGVQVSGKRLFVANAGNNTLEVFDLDARASSGRIALDAAPATLEDFGGRSLWLLNSAAADGGPLYVLDGAADPAVYFVPAGGVETTALRRGSPATRSRISGAEPRPGGRRD